MSGHEDAAASSSRAARKTYFGMYSGSDVEVKQAHNNLKKRASVLLPTPEFGQSVVPVQTDPNSPPQKTVTVRGQKFKTNSHVELKAALQRMNWDDLEANNFPDDVEDPFAVQAPAAAAAAAANSGEASSHLPPVIAKRSSDVKPAKGVLEMTDEAYSQLLRDEASERQNANRKLLDQKGKELLGATPDIKELQGALQKQSDGAVRSEMRVTALRSKMEQVGGGDVSGGAKVRNVSVVIEKTASKKVSGLQKQKSQARFAPVPDLAQVKK